MAAKLTGENDLVNVPKSFYADSASKFEGVLEPVAA